MTRGGRSKPQGWKQNPRTISNKNAGYKSDSTRSTGRKVGANPRRGRLKSSAFNSNKSVVDVHVEDGQRLQKVLAHAGLGSRRACEILISQGRVTVDGQVVTELGVRVDPSKQAIHVDSLRINFADSVITLALNKPVGVVSSMHDPNGRQDLSEWVMNRPERLYHIGRLDTDTSGLILLTNDGELSHRLTHPSYVVPKTYIATVEGKIGRGIGRQLMAGVELEDGLARADSFRILASQPGQSVVEIVLHEGRNRIVRRMLEAVGHPVLELVRTQIGPIKLGTLRLGATRVIGGAELASLMKIVGL